MNIQNIKQLADKSPVDQVKGIIEKQYPPSDQTENDLKYGQHRQAILINNGEGEKLMVNLMKEQIHILDSCEGNEIVISSTTNDKGDTRGIVFNTWQPEGKQYPNTSVKVWPEATIRVIPAGSSSQQPVEQQSKPVEKRSDNSAPTNTTPFDSELALAAYGYCKCLDMAAEVIADRPLLKDDGESLRAIATNLWMSSKHKVATLAPSLVGSTKPIQRGAEKSEPAPQAAQPKKEPSNAKIVALADEQLVNKCMAGHNKEAEGGLDETGLKFLAMVDAEMDRRDAWIWAYDGMCETSFSGNKEAVDAVYDEIAKLTGQKSPNVEKFIVCSQQSWGEQVMAEIKKSK